ncbi:MAG: hypothetical protein J6R43_02190 [Paludibacteraceae bacterium]|nr:hypothetical protein [Paludibacteraceae bacterium]
MRRNLDLIIILTLSVLVCGVLYLLYTDTAGYSMPKNDNIVLLQGVGPRRVAPRSTAQNVTWAPESMSGMSSSSSSRSVRVSPQNYRRSSMQATSSNSSLVSSSRSLMSNGVSNNGVSIVGGNNASFGRTAEANRSQSIAYGGGVSYTGVNVSSMRSSNPAVASSPSNITIGPRASSPSQSYIYGRTYSSRSIYGGATGSYASTASPLRVGGQYRAPGTMGGTWENSVGNWLDEHDHGLGSGDANDWWFSEDQAEDLYEELFGKDSEYWNEGMGNPPTIEDFFDWLRNNKDGKYHMPIGDVVPLFLLAFIYMVMVVLRKRKEA